MANYHRLILVLVIIAFVLLCFADAKKDKKKHDNKKNHHKNKHPGHAKKSGKGKGKGKGKEGASGAPHHGSMELIAQDEALFINTDATMRDTGIAQAAALGVTHIRNMLLAHMTHPCRGAAAQEYISQLDTMIATAASHGIEVQLTLTGVAAGWGVPRGCAAPYTKAMGINPDINGWYKPWVGEMVTHFAGEGVKRFSLWNEPNLPAFLCAGSVKTGSTVDNNVCNANMAKTAKLYYDLFKAGSQVINDLIRKGAIPKDVEILFGEFAGADIPFLGKVLSHGPVKANYISYHPYQYCTPPTTTKAILPYKPCHRAGMHGISWVPAMQKAIAAHGGRLSRRGKGGRVPLMLTEFGYFTSGPNMIPENLRVKWWPKALSFAQTHKVVGFNIYQFMPSPTSPPGLWDTSVLNAQLGASPTYLAIWKWAQGNGLHVSQYSK